MMKRSLSFPKLLSLFIAGLVSVLILQGTSIFSLSTPPASAGDTTIELMRSGSRPALSSLGLQASLESFIPSGLTRSSNPAEGTRGVIRTDDRVPVTSRSYPWSAIGRLEFDTPEGASICTGTLVNKDVVLTNAHCVVDPKTRRPHQNIRFAPNLIGGRLKNEADRATAIDGFVGTDFSDRPTPPHPDDWAFLKLDQPLGEKYGTIGWLAADVANLIENPERYIMVGYSGDFPRDNPGATASAHQGCSILGSTNDNVLRHNCDTTGGSSGGPILVQNNGQYRIVAVNSAERREGEQGPGIVNFATKISRIVERIQREGQSR
jgi:V8-like Glu-specific endopeptidase